MEMAVEKKWMSEDEAASYTSLSRSSLAKCRTEGKITYREYGRKIIYNREDLDRFIERHAPLTKSTEDRLSQFRQCGYKKNGKKII
jgi:excisionase family DNA binding protein